MNPMTYRKIQFRESNPQPFGNKGFALVVTLSLMILLTVIAAGLLSLSSVALRSSSQQSAEITARANARMALMLAIGELQKSTGPDQRITMTSSLRTGAEPANSNWTGSVDVSPTALTPDAKSAPIRWLISGDQPDPAKALTLSSEVNKGDALKLGTFITAPKVTKDLLAPVVNVTQGKNKGRYAWWLADEGAKARVDLAKSGTTPAADRDRLALSRTPLEPGLAKISAAWADFAPLPVGTINKNVLISMATTSLAGQNPSLANEYFNDLTTGGFGLPANVVAGGMKADLSLIFDKSQISKKFGERYLGATPTSQKVPPPVSQPNLEQYKAQITMQPLLGIWNPHNVAIRTTPYFIRWAVYPYFRLNFARPTGNGTFTDARFTDLKASDGTDRVVPKGYRAWFGDIVLEDTQSAQTLARYPQLDPTTTNASWISMGTQGRNFIRTSGLWNSGNNASVRMPEPVVSGANFPGTSKPTYLIEDLADDGVAAHIATWSFFTRTTNQIEEESQRLRGWIDSNPRALVTNPLWDGSNVNSSRESSGWHSTSQWIGAYNPPGKPKVVGDGAGGNRGLLGEGGSAIPEPEMNQAGGRYQGYGGAANTLAGGRTHSVVFDVPRSPLISLGRFQHAQLSRYNYEPGFVVGNSYANPRIPLEAVSNPNFNGINGFNVTDISYDVNRKLWDGYFFSTLGTDYVGGTGSFDGTSPAEPASTASVT